MKKYIFLIMSCFFTFLFCSCSEGTTKGVKQGAENKAVYKNDNKAHH